MAQRDFDYTQHRYKEQHTFQLCKIYKFTSVGIDTHLLNLGLKFLDFETSYLQSLPPFFIRCNSKIYSIRSSIGSTGILTTLVNS